MSPTALDSILEAFADGRVVPYLGAGVLSLSENCPVPATPQDLVSRLVTKGNVPHKLLKNLTGAAQFIENFKHRKTVVSGMTEAFKAPARPTSLHGFLARANAPLVVHVWYDDLVHRSMAEKENWGCVQGLSQSQHFGQWTQFYGADGTAMDETIATTWSTLVYEPIGAVAPEANYLVSDSDYVEVLTEIDIQTPIPALVQDLRRHRNFLFLGCRFNTQLDRVLAHQITKRSSDRHWAVMPETPTRNEERFLAEHGIERLDMSLEDFTAKLLAAGIPAPAAA